MNRVYKGQSALRLTVKTFTDLADILTAVIRFRKPDGSTGEFLAGIADAARGIIFHECIEGEINASGWWVFWAFVTFSDDRTVAGEAVRVFIWDEGGG
jgi:hypothetical protein